MLTLLLLILGAACAEAQTEDQAGPEIGGPALLMFYTEN